MLRIETKDRRGLDIITAESVKWSGVPSTPTTAPVREGPYNHFNGQVFTRFLRGIYSFHDVYLASAKSRCTSGRVYFAPASKLNDGYLYRGKLALYGVNISGAAQVSGFNARVVPVWNDRLADLAFVQAYAKTNEPDIYDSGTFLGELAETLSMLRHPFRGIHKFIFKDRRWKDPRRLVETGGDTWLEFRYGIQPLANDIAKIALLFQKKHELQSIFMQTKRSKVSQTFSWNGDTSNGIGPLQTHWHDRGDGTDEYNAGVSFYKNPGITGHVYQQLGLSVTQVPALLWELSPYSFVVDWMYNVGPWLRAITPNPYVQVLGGYVSRKRSETITRSSIGSTHSYYGDGPKNSSRLILQVDTLERRARLDLPATPVRKIDILNLKRSIDSVSLLWQKLPRSWRAAN